MSNAERKANYLKAMEKKYGSREAYLEEMQRRGSKGGKGSAPEDRPFFKNRNLAKRAGKLGGAKRKKSYET